jgi:hypothetical protein
MVLTNTPRNREISALETAENSTFWGDDEDLSPQEDMTQTISMDSPLFKGVSSNSENLGIGITHEYSFAGKITTPNLKSDFSADVTQSEYDKFMHTEKITSAKTDIKMRATKARQIKERQTLKLTEAVRNKQDARKRKTNRRREKVFQEVDGSVMDRSFARLQRGKAPRAGNRVHPRTRKRSNKTERNSLFRSIYKTVEEKKEHTTSQSRRRQRRNLNQIVTETARESIFLDYLPEIRSYLLGLIPTLKSASEEIINVIIECACYMYIVATATDYKQFTVATLWFGRKLISKSSTAVTHLCCNFIKTFDFDGFKSSCVMTESLGSVIDRIRYILSRVLNADICISLRNFVLSMLSLNWFPKDISTSVRDLLGKEKKLSFVGILTGILEGLSTIFKFAERLLAGESISTILQSTDPAAAALREFEELIQKNSMLYAGLPVEDGLCEREFLARCKIVLADAAIVIKTLAPLDYRKKLLQEHTKVLKLMAFTRQAIVQNRNRQTPLGIVIHGPPGIGKSLIVPYVCDIWSIKKGRDFSESHIHSRSKTSPFMEGYDPRSNAFLHYGEVGNMSEKQAMAKGDPLLLEIQSMIDSLPYNCDMAFSGKGQVYANPEMVVIDTNNEGLHIDKLMYSPAAVKRRFLFFCISVKDEFRIPGTTALDIELSLESDVPLLDKYNIEIYVYRPDGNRAVKETLFRSSDFAEYTQWLFDYFGNYIAMQDAVAEASSVNVHSDIMNALNLPMPIVAETGHDNLDVSDDDEKTVEFALDDFPNDLRIHDRIVTDEQSLTPPDLEFPHVHTPHGVERVETIDFVQHNAHMVTMQIQRAGWVALRAVIDRREAANRWFARKQALIAFCIMLLIGNGLINAICFAGGFSFNFYKIFDYLTSEAITRYMHTLDGRIERLRARSRHYWHLNFGRIIPFNPFQSYNWIVYAGAFAVFALALKKLLRNKTPLPESENSTFRLDSEVNNDLLEIEEKLEAEAGIRRVKPKNGQHWTVVAPRQVAPHRDSPDSLYRSILRNVRKCTVIRTEFRDKTYILGIKSNYALINTHFFHNDEDITIQVHPSFVINEKILPFNILIEKCDRVEICSDITLIRLRSFCFKDITKHIAPMHPLVTTGYTFCGDVKLSQVENLKIEDAVLGELTIQRAYKYEGDHATGLCGLPLIGKTDSVGSAILGLHCAGEIGTQACFAATIDHTSLFTAMNEWDNINTFTPFSIPVQTESMSMPHFKSPFSFESYPNITYLGKHDGNIVLPKKSQLRPLIPVAYLDDWFFEIYNHIPKEIYGKPTMRPCVRNDTYISPYNNWLAKLNKPPVILKTEVLDKVANVFADFIIESLAKEGITKLKPFPFQDAVNGNTEDEYFNRMNVHTSSGYGWKGKKSNYYPIVVDDEREFVREPIAELKSCLYNIARSYERREQTHCVMKMNTKDEPRPLEKCLNGSTRLFAITPQETIQFSRVVLGPLYSLMVQFSKAFGTAVGINMHTQSDELVRMLTEFSALIFEGDYRGYDVSIPYDISACACTVILLVLKRLGYNEYALKMAQGLLSDGLFAILELNMDVLMRPGMWPSGGHGTAEINSIKGIIFMMYFWYSHSNLSDKEFFEYILAIVYGDDLLVAVKAEVSEWFNAMTYSHFCKDVYGIEFTSATKTDIVNDFVDVDSMTFLKRNFVLNTERNKYEGRLDLDSLYKSLQWYVPSKDLTFEEQILATMRSALYEFYFHSDLPQYTVLLSKFTNYIKTEVSDVIKIDLPTYVEIDNKIYGEHINGSDTRVFNTEKERVRLFSLVSSTTPLGKDVTGLVGEARQWTSAGELTTWCSNLNYNEGRALLDQLRVEKEILREEIDMSPVQYDIDDFIHNSEVAQETVHNNELKVYKRLLCRFKDIEVTMATLKRSLLKRKHHPYSESGREIITESGTDVNTEAKAILVEENLQDETGEIPDYVSTIKTVSLRIGQEETLNLADALTRPVLIGDYSISPGAHDNKVFKLWDLMTLNPYIRAKLRNSAYFKANLRVTVEISGVKQSYGAMLVSYQPYPTKNETLIGYTSLISAIPAAREGLLNYLSQSPNSGIMDVNDNKPLIIDIPFISPNPMFRLYNGVTAISDVTSFNDFDEAGSLYLYTMTFIDSVSASPTDVYVRVYANFEDVQLGAPTATVIGITTESGRELLNGPKESISTRSLSSVLRNVVNKIPSFAESSMMMLSGLGKLAVLFGFSKPPVVSIPVYVKNEPFRNGAQLIGSYTGKRITMDPLQELSIDPRVVGTDIDELSIQHLASIKSFLTSFVWTAASPVMSSPLFNIRVSPSLSTITLGIVNQYIQQTALSFAVSPCTYWHGDITFTFKVVASGFHKGKLLFYFEPNFDQHVLIDQGLALNKNYSVVMDLQSSREIELTVKWASPRAFNPVLFAGYEKFLYGASFGDGVNSYYGNGYVGVVPFTELQSPDASSISILVFVHSNNMTVSAPTNRNLPVNRVITESGSDQKEGNDSDMSFVLNPSNVSMDHLGEQHFGEILYSLRSLMHRFATTHNITINSGDAGDLSYKMNYQCIPPPAPAYGDEDVHELTLLQYIRYAYLGMRGGTRHRVSFYNEDFIPMPTHRVTVSLNEPTAVSTYSSDWVDYYPKTYLDGSVAYIPTTNGGIEFETPYYSPNLFSFAFADNDVGADNSSGEMLSEWFRKYVITIPGDYTKTGVVTIDTASADDFSLLRFNGAPFHSHALA